MLEGSSDPFHRQEQHDPRDARRLGFLRGHRTGPRPGPTWGPHLGAPGVRRGYSVLSFLYSEPSIPLGSRGGGRLWFVQGVPASNDTDVRLNLYMWLAKMVKIVSVGVSYAQKNRYSTSA